MRRSQQGSLTKNNNAWHCRYRDIERQPDGTIKHVNRSHRLCDGKIRRADALEMMNHYVSTRVNAGRAIEAASTVAHFIECEFLPDRKTQVAASTFKAYSDIWRYHGYVLDPSIRLRDFTVYDGQQLMRGIASRATLAKTTLKHIKSFWTSVFTHALRLGFIDSGNPMHYVQLPQGATMPDTYAYAPTEIEAMLRVLPEPANTVVMVAAHTGLRKSEIRALVWGDWRDGCIYVERSMWRQQVKETKSKASKAPVPVTRELQARLTAFKPANAEATDPMFIGQKLKRPLDLHNLAWRTIEPALRNCGQCGLSKEQHANITHPFAALPKWQGWHAFRRGLASYLHSRGVQDLLIQRILRHSNVAITQACYIKIVSDDVRAAMDRMDGAFSGKPTLIPPSKGVA